MTEKKPGKLRKLNAPDVIRGNPRMYWGTETPSVEVVNAAILDQLRVEGCMSMMVEKISDWQFISTETNWVERFISEEGDIKNLFLNLRGFPGGGGNGLRFEYLLYLLVNDLCISINGCLTVVKGIMNEELMKKAQKKSINKVTICYSESALAPKIG